MTAKPNQPIFAACARGAGAFGLLLASLLLLLSPVAMAQDLTTLPTTKNGDTAETIPTTRNLNNTNTTSTVTPTPPVITTSSTAPATTTGTVGATGSTVTPANTTGATAITTTIVNGANPACNGPLAAAAAEGRRRGLTIALDRDSKLYQYQIAGAYAGQCVGALLGYIDRLRNGIDGLYSAAHKGDVVKMAITLVANQLLEAAYRQLVSALENQICSITNQVTSAIDSAINNAICIPSGGIGGLGNMFSGNINLNLSNLQCDGLAIDVLGYFDIDPVTGQPRAGSIASGAAPIGETGIYGQPAGSFGGLAGAGWRVGEGAFNEGEPELISNPGDGTITGIVGSISASSSFKCFDLQKAIQFNSSRFPGNYQGSPPDGYCADAIRQTLCAGGMEYFCTPGKGDAYTYGNNLIPMGYEVVADQNTTNYRAEPGDIIVNDRVPGPTPGTWLAKWGHIQMFNGSTWGSDYQTPNMLGGRHYRVAGRPYKIYRPKPTVNQKADGTCR